MKTAIIASITGYQWFFSPFLTHLFGKGCRFSPTCSVYAKEVISDFGVKKGVPLALKRLAKCQPFSKT